MKLYVTGLAVLLALAGAQSARGQAREVGDPPRCPAVAVSCADDSTGAPLTFTASVSGGDPSTGLTYGWIVSAGVIVGGEGTSSITVNTAGTSNMPVKATVKVGGMPDGCSKEASCSTDVQGCRLTKVDEYGDISDEDETARLDNFAIELQNNPVSRGYVIAYAGRRARTGEAKARAERARDYLIGQRGIDAAKVVMLDGGHREGVTVELFIRPPDMAAPTATPTVEPGEVELIKDGGARTKRRGRVRPKTAPDGGTRRRRKSAALTAPVVPARAGPTIL